MHRRNLSLIVTALLSWTPVQAQQCSAFFNELGPLQIKAEATIHGGRYITSRSFYEYMKAFGPAFVADMTKLDEQHFWVDLGAGTGNALKDYSEYKFNRHEKSPHLIGVSTQALSLTGAKKSISWLGGRLWEDIPKDELPVRIDRATDFYGILSYTDQVSEYLNEVFSRMPVGGKFYAYISNRDIVRSDISLLGRFLSSQSLTGYLKDIPNLQVEEKIVWDFLAMQKMRVITLTKNAEVQFPELQIVSYHEGTPPYRTFIKKK